MGTASYTVTRYGPSRGQAAALASSEVIASGTHSTTTNASNISGLTVKYGEVLRIHASEAMRVWVAGTATASTGHYIPADTLLELEVHQGGAVSIIDVA